MAALTAARPLPKAGDRAPSGLVASSPAAAAGPAPPASGRTVASAGSVALRGLGKVYQSSAGAVTALEAIDLDIPAGRIFGIIGRSGAGKSSLLRTINRLERPSAGRVLVDGQDIALLDGDGLVALRRRIGMIFQHFNLLSAKTVRDNIGLPLRVAGVPRQQIDRRVDELLGLVGLADKHRTYPSRLSGGQKQRVGIARALVHRPEILLCDEATSALDSETTLSILALLKDINRAFGITIILITHEIGVIREICDDVLVLEGGRIAEIGPIWRVFGDPQHEATRALLRPFARGLPDDIAARLHPDRAEGDETILELTVTGAEGDIDLGLIASRLGARPRLLTATVERIVGRAEGRALIAATLADDTLSDPVLAAVGRWKVLGHVRRDA